MKTILAPIDYSKVSLNALRYAANLATEINARLVLLHIYDIPIPKTDGFMVLVSPATLEKDNRKRIEKTKKEITRKFKSLKTEAIVHHGFPDEQVLRIAKEKKADLIVMGITGAGAMAQTLAGSCLLSVLKKSKTPVLAIPEKAKFSKAGKIVYACDFEKIENHSLLEPVKEMALLFKAELLILNVLNGRVTVPAVTGAAEGIELEHLLGNIKHSYWYSEEVNVIDAVNDFVHKHGAKMIAMFARRHFFPENIMHRRVTKRMALHTHVPFLSMHE